MYVHCTVLNHTEIISIVLTQYSNTHTHTRLKWIEVRHMELWPQPIWKIIIKSYWQKSTHLCPVWMDAIGHFCFAFKFNLFLFIFIFFSILYMIVWCCTYQRFIWWDIQNDVPFSCYTHTHTYRVYECHIILWLLLCGSSIKLRQVFSLLLLVIL